MARGSVIYAGDMTETVAGNNRRRDRVILIAFGAVYLAFVVAWLFAVRANQLIGIDDRFLRAMSDFGEFFAIMAPALWFFTVLVRVSSLRVRSLLLAVGLVLLFPYPLFFGVFIP